MSAPVDTQSPAALVISLLSFVAVLLLGLVIKRNDGDRKEVRDALKELSGKLEVLDRHRAANESLSALAADRATRLTEVEKKVAALAEAAAHARGASSATMVGQSIDNQMGILITKQTVALEMQTRSVEVAEATAHSIHVIAERFSRRTTPPAGHGAVDPRRLPQHDPPPSPGRYGNPPRPSRPRT